METLKFQVEARGAENLVLAHDGTHEYDVYLNKLSGIATKLNAFKQLHDEQFSDLELKLDLQTVKAGFGAIKQNVSNAISKLPKHSQFEANHYYNNVLQELQRSFYISELTSPLSNLPDGLAFLIEKISFTNNTFTVKEIDSTLFDRYINKDLHNDLVAYVTVYNALHARLGDRITLIDQLIIGNEGLQYNRKMDVAKIGDLSKFL